MKAPQDTLDVRDLVARPEFGQHLRGSRAEPDRRAQLMQGVGGVD